MLQVILVLQPTFPVQLIETNTSENLKREVKFIPPLEDEEVLKNIGCLPPLGVLPKHGLLTDQQPQLSLLYHELMTKAQAQEVRNFVSRLYPS